jgi:hypothetical protein
VNKAYQNYDLDYGHSRHPKTFSGKENGMKEEIREKEERHHL